MEADVLHNFATQLLAEAEQQQLVKRLQKAEILNTELQNELETAKVRLATLRTERNILMDKVYEKEVATLEFTSGSSDEDESIPVTQPSRPITQFHTTAPQTSNNIPSQSKISIPVARIEREERSTSSKKKRVVKSAEVAAATPRKALSVPTDDQGNAILPVTVGVVTLHSTGTIIHDRPAFHNKRYIWPVGFHSSRPYLSAIDPEAQTVFHSQIIDGGTGPVFDVYADDNPDQHFQSPTPTGAWTSIVKQVNSIRGRDYSNSASGPDFFGLSNSTISMIIDHLPDADKCSQYQKKVYELISAPNRVPVTKHVPKKHYASLESDAVDDGSNVHDDDLTVDFDD